MQFLADESCDALIVRTLRQLDYDVTYIAEFAPGDIDEHILALALQEERVLITEDRDFCELVFRDKKPTFGVILVRFPPAHRAEKAPRITALVNTYADQLAGAMITLTPTNMKRRPLPEH